MTRPSSWVCSVDDIAAAVFLVGVLALGTPLDRLGLPLTLVLVMAGAGSGFLLRRLLPPTFDDLALVPPVLVVLVEVLTTPLSVAAVVLAAAMGVALLLWAGAEPRSGVSIRQQFEPALVPALGVALAVAVLFFLPKGTGGQEGLAALTVAAALGLAAWLYLRGAADVLNPEPTP